MDATVRTHSKFSATLVALAFSNSLCLTFNNHRPRRLPATFPLHHRSISCCSSVFFFFSSPAS